MQKIILVVMLLMSSLVSASHGFDFEKKRKAFIKCLDVYDAKGAQAILKENPDFDVFGKTEGDENLLEYAIGVAVETRDSDSGKIVLAMHGHPSFDRNGGCSRLGIGYSEFVQRWVLDSFTYGPDSPMPRVNLNPGKPGSCKSLLTDSSKVGLSDIEGARNLYNFATKVSVSSTSGMKDSCSSLYCDDEEIGISDLFS